ncbi:MAG: lysylphosphatidylglycerol synthase transmembrane domain-containing protein [Haloarculaceae archaeon]
MTDPGPESQTGGLTERAGGLRQRVVSFLQWAVALGAFWYVARDVDWGRTASELAGLSPVVVAAVLAVTAVEFGTRFSMWYVLVNGRGDASLATTARIDLVIKFVNHVVPSKASGHSVAPLVLRHYTDLDWSEAVSIAGVNTGLYATLYGVTALAGLATFAPRLGRGWLFVLLLSTGVYLTAGALVLLAGRRLDAAGRLVGRFEGMLGRVPHVGDRLAGLAGAVPSFTADSAGAFRALSSQPLVVTGYALGWAGTLMVVPGTRVWLLLSGLGGGFSPAVLLPVVLVMAYSVTVLPLTPGGVGVAEASATAVFISLGVAPDLATVVVLVDRTLGVYLPAVIGWVPMAELDLNELLAREA